MPYVGWVCCWFSPLLREVFLRVLWFYPSPQKPTFSNSNSTRNQVDEEPLCGCATCKSLFIYLFLFYLVDRVLGGWEGRGGVLWDVTGSTVELELFLGSWNNLGKKVLPLSCKFLETLSGSNEHIKMVGCLSLAEDTWKSNTKILSSIINTSILLRFSVFHKFYVAIHFKNYLYLIYNRYCVSIGKGCWGRIMV